MKTIEQHNQEGIGQKAGGFIGDVLFLDWIFSKWYEKILVTGALLWAGWSIVKLFIY